MRMWMISPKELCRNHLLGEHYEIHKALGNLNHKGTWTRSLTNQGYLEPQNFKSRHDELVKEMEHRGYKHKSPLVVSCQVPVGYVNRNKSILDLRDRCTQCFKESVSNGNKK